ncbi:cupin domain-containing protein [Paenibacillus sp. SYP-B3998]|uniref:Cupin domain-containing protein n=1 Tax=Paenibacillus sp. SYP-B3998 TaxID=2678564 RepID=A0A6G3ZRU8_9BACL|nr:sugar phosphate nucleotidyltransferase [Paenibacillus sp. SYP-B3998]NEW04780.1 cupin domain-containing protein [Paenibacillus sp. SYP-B3998]
MRIVLLSGGSGKRLWPLSNEIRSKAFLKVLKSDDGVMESMIQRVCRQLDEVGLLQSTCIVTHKSQVEIIQNHVGDRVPIISESHKKGTFTAIALAASYFHSVKHADLNETICILPVDTYVETAFFQLLHKFPPVLSHSQADLALLGTSPKHPSSQYGYIVPIPPIDNKHGYLSVSQFVEKPDEENAKLLIDRNALWNCGIFAFSLAFMLANLTDKGLPTRYEDWQLHYEKLPEISFDHEVVEKISHAVVIPYSGTWWDLGSWSTLTNHFESNVIGIGQISKESVNTHLVNELSYPIQVINVSNIIVAASPDGILVANKNNSDQIKERLSYTRQIPMYEEKRWGNYRVLDHSIAETEAIVKKMMLLPGKNISYHKHQRRKEIWTILSGSGEFIMDDHLYCIQTGSVLEIPCGAKHGMKATTALEFIEIQIGSELVEEDIIRIAMTWEDSVQFCKNRD